LSFKMLGKEIGGGGVLLSRISKNVSNMVFFQ
jgi:hypothetical protein